MTGRGCCVVPLDSLAKAGGEAEGETGGKAVGEAVAGAKLARLARLAHPAGGGVRVPRGFAVTAEALRRHLAESGLGDVLSARLAAVPDPSDRRALAEAAAGLRSLVQRTPVTRSLRARIADALALLGDGPVAVRSSAVSEDGSEHSFAGMYDSFLNVRGTDDVVAAVQGCWASLFTDRCLAYRMHAGLGAGVPVMGVGVMEMVPARVSGVAFSMHPVSGRRDRMVVEAAPGAGGAVAGGPVPDRVEVDRTGGRVVRHEYGVGGPLLSGEDRCRVAATVDRVEELLGHPVDVEWALDSRHRVWVLQARPVTGITGIGSVAESDDIDWDPVTLLCDL